MVTGRIDAALWPYVEILGLHAAARLFLHLGGSEVYIPARRSNCGRRSGAATKLAPIIGPEALARVTDLPFAGGYIRVPLAHVFLARYLASRGKNVSQIAARLRKTDTSVRLMLKPDAVRRARLDKFARKIRESIAAEIAESHEPSKLAHKGTQK